MPVNADSSPTSRSTACRLSSLLAGWIVSILASQFLLVQQSTGQIKNAEFMLPQQLRGAMRGCWDQLPLYVCQEFTSTSSTTGIVYLNVINWHASKTQPCLCCPHVYLPEYTTHTSTLVSWYYHLEVYERRSLFFTSKQFKNGQKEGMKTNENAVLVFKLREKNIIMVNNDKSSEC